MSERVVAQMAALSAKSTETLKRLFLELHGREATSSNRDFLVQAVAQRIQQVAGESSRALHGRRGTEPAKNGRRPGGR